MAFIDELTIKASAGKGGDGVVRFRHEKYREFGGPSGGNGGRGGDVYVKAVRNVHLLSQYRHKKSFQAENGKAGGKNSLYGEDGHNFNIELPVGSIVTNTETKKVIRLDTENERILLLKGGNGGYGNEHFKSSTNQAPEESTPGKLGETGTFLIEIELIADVGLIGLPSAGKTSLLNALTKAHGKVGDYPFTTLEPALGEMHGYIFADIPGLIEGAADGKGLGHKFLKHIRRTKMLVHLLALDNEDLTIAYQTIRGELEKFDPELIAKKEVILLTKADLVDDQAELQEQLEQIRTLTGHSVYAITLYDNVSIKETKDNLLADLNQLL